VGFELPVWLKAGDMMMSGAEMIIRKWWEGEKMMEKQSGLL
jgi:hypothetical protein